MLEFISCLYWHSIALEDVISMATGNRAKSVDECALDPVYPTVKEAFRPM